jgi:hypothetical protein
MAMEPAEKSGAGEDSGEDGEVARSEGPVAFARVAAVGFYVEQIVGNVGGGGAEAEADEGDSGVSECSGAEHMRENMGTKMRMFLAH